MSKKIVSTEEAPAAIGPYSQAVKAGGLVFTSGQIPLDPASGTVVKGGIREQTHQVLKNLQHVLEAAGSSLNDMVKTTVFIADMNEFGTVNDIYAEYAGAEAPARSCVEVARLPKDVKIEIEAVALVK